MLENERKELEELKQQVNDLATVSKASAEYSLSLYKKKVKIRDIIILILFIVALASNIIWLVVRSQYEKVTETTETITTIEGVEQTTDGGGNKTIKAGPSGSHLSMSGYIRQKTERL